MESIIFHDKKPSKELSNFKDLLHHAGEVIFVTDPSGLFVFVNPAFEKMYGYSAEEVVGRATPRILKSDKHDESTYKKMWVTLLENNSVSLELINKTKSGRLIPVEVFINTILDSSGNVVGFRANQRDISKRRDAEEKLSLAKTAAEEANRAKAHFLAVMSHEIRTPMNAILGMCELLGEEGLDPKQQQYLDTIYSAGSTLKRILTDVLDFSRMESNQYHIHKKEFKLLPLIKNAFNLIYLSQKKDNLRMKLELGENIPERIIGDAERLSQIIFNVLSNAVKFTNEGEVTLSVKIPESDPFKEKMHTILFSVTDTGIGIPEGSQKYLFRKFSRIDEAGRNSFGGTGLGLAICKHLVEMMGGNIGVESPARPVSIECENPGTRVWFTLRSPLVENKEKLEAVAELSEGKDQAPGKWAVRKKILLVEDDPLNRLLMQAILEKCDIDLDTAEDGLQGIRLAEKNRYDIILMDLQMPNMNGYDATRHIRENFCKKVPIVAISANNLLEDKERCFESGVDYFLSKPINRKDLLKLLDSI